MREKGVVKGEAIPGLAKPVEEKALAELAASRDGERVRAMLEAGGAMSAAERGDMETFAEAVRGALKTQAGERLRRELMELMK